MDDVSREPVDRNIQKILEFISDSRGVDLTSYRRTFVERHIRSRIADAGAANGLKYIDYLKNNPGEFDRLLDKFSINVTSFFRDKDVFDAFRTGVIPGLINNDDRRLIRIWSAACATGQEPYSIAIMMSEAVEGMKNRTIRIWATDIDSGALNKAKLGRYDASEIKGIPEKLLEKYFDRDGDTYTVKDSLKALVRFMKHDLISDQPLKFMDVVFCRHVMIYFNREEQETLIAKFAQGLNSDGYLVMAKVESIWDKDLFVPVDHVRKIYKKAQ